MFGPPERRDEAFWPSAAATAPGKDRVYYASQRDSKVPYRMLTFLMRRQALHRRERIKDRERRRGRIRIARVFQRIPLQRQRLAVDQLAPLQEEVLEVVLLALLSGEGNE